MKLNRKQLRKMINEAYREFHFSQKGQDAWYQSILDTMQPKHKAFAEQNYRLFKYAVNFYVERTSRGYGQMPQRNIEIQREIEKSFDLPAEKIQLLGQLVRILLMQGHETRVAMKDESKRQFMQDSDKGPILYGDKEPGFDDDDEPGFIY